MWVLTKIDPTTFNVVSDLVAKVVAGLLLAALGFVYPQMVYASLKRGNGIDLDGIISPPASLWDAACQFIRGRQQQRRSQLLLLIVTFILILANFSHALADVFLKFTVVEVGSNQTFFLGSEPRGVSTYRLIGDRLSTVSTITVNNVILYQNKTYFNTTTDRTATGPRDMGLLVTQADLIANGLSRLSFLPPLWLDMGYFALEPGEKPKTFSGDLGIQCHGSPDYPNILELVVAHMVSIPNTSQTIVHNITYVLHDYKTHFTNYTVALLDCDYEETTPYKTISETPSENGWQVVDRIYFDIYFYQYLANHSNIGDFSPNDSAMEIAFMFPVAVHNEEYTSHPWWDDFEPHLSWLTENETALPVSRGFRGWTPMSNDGNETDVDFGVVGENDWPVNGNDTLRVGGENDWQYGRRVRDGLTFRLGHVWWYNSTGYIDGPHPGSMEFQVEYSLLTGPGATRVSTGDIDTRYTLSSWSRNCPFQDPETMEISLIAGDDVLIAPDIVTGCVIDFGVTCNSSFPEEVAFTANDTTLEMPRCWIIDFHVMYLSGNIVVDPYMLAAYAGIATRNGGLNTVLKLPNARIAVNSLAAAYVLTRKPVSGTVAYTDVRASIGPSYVVFMVLPLLFILPLLGFVRRRAPPIPRSIWDILVLGRCDDNNNIPQCRGSDDSYPPRRKKLAFGNLVCEQTGGEKLGLGESFVPVTHPFHERESSRHKKMASTNKNGAPKQEQSKHDYWQDAEEPAEVYI